MIGFINTSKTFSLAAIQVLQLSANNIYSTIQDTFYPVGGIPTGEGAGIYSNSNTLIAGNFPIVYYSYTHQFESVDETIVIEDKYLTGGVEYNPIYGVWGSGKIAVHGAVGDNRTAIIRSNKISDVNHVGISINDVDNVIIEGNYFDTVKSPIRLRGVKNVTIRYNKLKNHAVATYINGLGNHAIVINYSVLDSCEVAYNLVDRSDAPWEMYDLTDGSDDRNNTAMANDYVNFGHTKMSEGTIGYCHNNILLGSEHIGETQSGCGFILDADSYDIEFKANISVNATQTAFGTSNSRGWWINNIGVYTYTADQHLVYPYKEDTTDETYGKLLPYSTRIIGMGYYTGGWYCPTVDGTAGPHVIKGNRGARWGVTKPIHIGSIDSNIDITHVDGSNTFNVIEGNSFGWTTDNVTYPTYYWEDYPPDCPHDIWKYYLEVLNSEPNSPAPTTPEEAYRIICDPTFTDGDAFTAGEFYTAGMATNGAMFTKWGTADNHEMYFDESRKV